MYYIGQQIWIWIHSHTLFITNLRGVHFPFLATCRPGVVGVAVVTGVLEVLGSSWVLGVVGSLRVSDVVGSSLRVPDVVGLSFLFWRIKLSERLGDVDGDYDNLLTICSLPKLSKRRHEMCMKLFTEIQDKDHRLFPLLVPFFNCDRQTRVSNDFKLPFCRTNRLKDSFIPYCIRTIFKS